MKKWWTLILLALLLAMLALSSGIWLPWLLSFIGANSDVIQGLADLVQIVLWVAAAVLGIWGYLRRRDAQVEVDVGVDTQQQMLEVLGGVLDVLTFAVGLALVVGIGGLLAFSNGVLVSRRAALSLRKRRYPSASRTAQRLSAAARAS